AVDRLIASPRYGERWGRHWLDIAGYADSDGYTERDPERKYAYKYRDYVIRSLNADKPWNEFIVEQLAGDELLTPPYSNLTPEQADKLIATGFLRCGPDGTGDGGVDQAVARNDVMAETIKIVSTSLLGLSVGCAQCHNHRFDPISQVDYYRLRAVFEPGYDVSNWRAPNARLVSLWSDEQRKLAADVDAEVKKIAADKNADMEQIVNDILEREVAKLPEELRQPAREARATDAKKRTPEQQKLLKEYPSLLVTSSSAYLYDQKRVDAHQKKFAELTTAAQAKKPPEDFVQCLTEVPGKIPATKVFFRGDHRQPREAVEPAELAVLNATHAAPLPADDPALPTSGRRLAYARQLTDGRHPLVGRVLVNRFWMHHFGRGLVASPADFGAQGERPTHPELLDWLVTSFTSPTAPRGGWSLKNLHREIVMSSTFKQSSRRPESLASRDPDNRLLGRMSIRRLDAEVIRDSILATSGVINSRAFGPAVPVSPDEVGQVTIGVDTRDTAGRPTGKSRSIGGEEYRRSVFVQVRRTLPLEMLEMFDAPTPTPNCESRTPSTVAPQALMLLNNEFVIAQSELFAKRVQEEAGPDPVSQAARAWQIAFGAQPAPAELEDLVKFMAEQTQIYRDSQAEQAAAKNAVDADAASKAANKAANAKKSGEKKTETVHPPEFHALANLCQGLLSSNLFLYVE
ncbi:MAG TPA: DUF1553 domain-containing protein, partial [Pirellulaceae bacterium]|nr:DUF1553 domain-containing protein [Pirellulaceae bacterium]